jgi:hypothetical protein
MIHRIQTLVICSFLVVAQSYVMPRRAAFGMRLASSVDDDKAVECFIVNDEEVYTEGVPPEVVCTSEPDGYAWFNVQTVNLWFSASEL